MSITIYSVEDDENISYVINKTLAIAGYDIKSFVSSDELFKQLAIKIPDILLLDIMLPNVSGLEIIEQIRGNEKYRLIYTIIISAKTHELDRAKGLNIGADDYITKPFSVLELTAKINAFVRRMEKDKSVLKCRDIIMNVLERKCIYKDLEVSLTLKEFSLLQFLLEKFPRLATKEEILKNVWGYDFLGETRTLDMHIKALRQKLDDKNQEMIVTVRGIGYKVVA